METWHGKIDSTNDALLLFEACRLGILKRITRRLSEGERASNVAAGAIFIWDEQESGIKRWTDGRSWSPSRIHGSFLIYKEVDKKGKIVPRTPTGDGGPGELVYKEGGLVKKALSITTMDDKHQHLVSYFVKDDLDELESLKTPSSHPLFADITIPNEMYPEFVPDGHGGLSPAGSHISAGSAGGQHRATQAALPTYPAVVNFGPYPHFPAPMGMYGPPRPVFADPGYFAAGNAVYANTAAAQRFYYNHRAGPPTMVPPLDPLPQYGYPFAQSYGPYGGYPHYGGPPQPGYPPQAYPPQPAYPQNYVAPHDLNGKLPDVTGSGRRDSGQTSREQGDAEGAAGGEPRG